jgi:hypothetical protein
VSENGATGAARHVIFAPLQDGGRVDVGPAGLEVGGQPLVRRQEPGVLGGVDRRPRGATLAQPDTARQALVWPVRFMEQ